MKTKWGKRLLTPLCTYLTLPLLQWTALEMQQSKLHCTYIMSANFISTTGHCNSSIDMPQLATWLLQASIFLTCTFQGPQCTPACRCSRVAHRWIYICSALLFYRNQLIYLGTSTLMGVWLWPLPLIALNYRQSSALSCSCVDKENFPKRLHFLSLFHSIKKERVRG